VPNPFFSIIIPTYNAAHLISGAVESVLCQDYKDFEILIMDGHSSDNTVATVSAFNDKRIRIFVEKDGGIYDAMNKAVDQARGKWLYFLGSDDRMYRPDILGTISKVCEDDIHIAYGKVTGEIFGGVYGGPFTQEDIQARNICHQAIFYRKDVFTKMGKYDLRFRAHADWDFNMRWMFSRTIRSKFVDVVVAEYASGGYAAIHGDPLFFKLRNLRYLHYSRKALPTRRKLELLTLEIKRATKLKDVQQLIRIFRTAMPILLSRPFQNKGKGDKSAI